MDFGFDVLTELRQDKTPQYCEVGLIIAGTQGPILQRLVGLGVSFPEVRSCPG